MSLCEIHCWIQHLTCAFRRRTLMIVSLGGKICEFWVSYLWYTTANIPWQRCETILRKQTISNPCSWTTIAKDKDGKPLVSNHPPPFLEQPIDWIPERRPDRSWNLGSWTCYRSSLVRTLLSSFLRDTEISAVVSPRTLGVILLRLNLIMKPQLSMGFSGFMKNSTSTGHPPLFVVPG